MKVAPRRTHVEDGVAAVEREVILHLVGPGLSVRVLRGREGGDARSAVGSRALKARAGGTNARVGHPAVGLHEDGRAEVLVLVPPVRRARRRAARAENALAVIGMTENTVSVCRLERQAATRAQTHYMPSSLARSAGDWRYSPSAGGLSFLRKGSMLLYCL